MRVRLWMSLLAVAASLSVMPVVAHAAARVPRGFVGVNLDGPALAPASYGRTMDTMVSHGVESIRIVFNWDLAQPFASFSAVPRSWRIWFRNEHGVPTDFAFTDQLVGFAASRGLSVLPVVMYAPPWAALPQVSNYVTIPSRPQPYANFMAALVRRYGPHGTFWTANPHLPKIPIRLWEVWNEPLFPYDWSTQPFEQSYVAVLRATHTAVKRADRGAKVVLAGLPNFAWKTLDVIYQIPGARQAFDVVDAHPYTKTPAGVITFLKLVRQAMDANGDRRKPMLAGEIGWPSSVGHKTSQSFEGIETTEAGQAHRIAAVIPLLAANRRRLRLLRFYYYTWMGYEHSGAPSFYWAGLLGYHKSGQIVQKPALTAFARQALKVERCKQKASVATRCALPG